MGYFDRQQAGGQPDRARIQAQAQRDFDDIRANPGQYIRQANVDIPQEIQNDPRAMCMHLINTGQVPQGRMRAAQPLINMLMGRR